MFKAKSQILKKNVWAASNSIEFRSHEPKFVQTCATHTVSTDPQTMDSW